LLENFQVSRFSLSLSLSLSLSRTADGPEDASLDERIKPASSIPADQVSWGAGSNLAMWNRQVLREILEKQVANASRTVNEQKIGDLYATCMEQESSGANDRAAIQPLLAQINGMKDKREIAGVLAAIHGSFGQAWQGNDNQTAVAMFGYGPQPDYNDVSRVVAG
jgi:putative endopeptidase